MLAEMQSSGSCMGMYGTQKVATLCCIVAFMKQCNALHFARFRIVYVILHYIALHISAVHYSEPDYSKLLHYCKIKYRAEEPQFIVLSEAFLSL